MFRYNISIDVTQEEREELDALLRKFNVTKFSAFLIYRKDKAINFSSSDWLDPQTTDTF